jgi:hypothetical protein
VSAWAPWYETDKECLEKVQRRAVRMISVPEFIDPDLGMKTSIFVKNSPKRSVSFQFVARDAGISMF